MSGKVVTSCNMKFSVLQATGEIVILQYTTMLTKDDLEQIGKLINASVDASEKRVSEKIEGSEKRVKQHIQKTESVIVAHFDRRVGDHEKRIKQLEDQLSTHKN